MFCVVGVLHEELQLRCVTDSESCRDTRRPLAYLQRRPVPMKQVGGMLKIKSHNRERTMLPCVVRQVAHSMIPLGSCTMKLNATSEMMPVSWPQINQIHPFAPEESVEGYEFMIKETDELLKTITGFDAISQQPNSGATGEYTGLLAISGYFESIGEERDICLIPSSAHGTNPASAVMAGMKVVVVENDKQGNIDMNDLKEKIKKHQKRIAAIMITYPSTYGVFEENITVCLKSVQTDSSIHHCTIEGGGLMLG